MTGIFWADNEILKSFVRAVIDELMEPKYESKINNKYRRSHKPVMCHIMAAGGHENIKIK